MFSFPEELTQYWLNHTLEGKSPAYLHVTDTGHLLAWGGAIERYGLMSPRTGGFIGDCLPMLAHSFPMRDVTESMKWIETELGLIFDAHFYFSAVQGWILLLESGAEAQKAQSLVQQGNELRLLRHKYDKVVQRQMAHEESSLLLESLLDLSSDNQSAGISILQIRLNQQASTAEFAQPNCVAQLNRELNAVFSAAAAESGLIHHVFGQTVAVLFGLLPSSSNSARLAIQSASRFVAECPRPQSASNQELAPGLVITTGTLDFSIRPVKNRKIFHLLGQTIVRTEEMLRLSQPGVLLIDQNTFQLSGDARLRFSSWSPHGPTASTQLYVQPLNGL